MDEKLSAALTRLINLICFVIVAIIVLSVLSLFAGVFLYNEIFRNW